MPGSTSPVFLWNWNFITLQGLAISSTVATGPGASGSCGVELAAVAAGAPGAPGLAGCSITTGAGAGAGFRTHQPNMITPSATAPAPAIMLGVCQAGFGPD